MNTREVAESMVAFIKEGKNSDAQHAHYAESVVSYEQDGTKAEGLAAVMEKSAAFGASLEDMRKYDVAATYVGADSFILDFDVDFTIKGGQVVTGRELGFYKLNSEGKVVEEYFFMMPL